MTPLAAHYRRLLAHEDDAHAKTLASLESVPADRRESPEYRRAAGIFAHTVLVRRLWLGRMAGGPRYTGPAFPDAPDLPAVTADWQTIRADWERFLDGLTDADLGRAFEYDGLFGGRFRSRVGDVLPHLFSHAAYHRGQIALLVRQAGGTPALTDFIYADRETLSAG